MSDGSVDDKGIVFLNMPERMKTRGVYSTRDKKGGHYVYIRSEK